MKFRVGDAVIVKYFDYFIASGIVTEEHLDINCVSLIYKEVIHNNSNFQVVDLIRGSWHERYIQLDYETTFINKYL